MSSGEGSESSLAGLSQAFAMIIVSEIGDKTFLIVSDTFPICFVAHSRSQPRLPFLQCVTTD